MSVRGRGRSQRRPIAGLVALALIATACSSSKRASVPTSASAPPTTTRPIPPTPVQSTCALNVPTLAVTGADGTAAAIGWAGNSHGVVTCLGGSFFVQGDIGKAFGFGIYDGGPTTWVDADGYLPEQITTFHRDGARVAITELADRVVIGGHAYVVVYARVATGPATVDPQPSPGLIALPSTTRGVHDYAIAVDAFGLDIPWPSSTALTAAGSFDAHAAHMRAFWDAHLRTIAEVSLPDRPLDDAYRAGFIATEIARSGTHLNTGVNGYGSEFSHDVIGILANLFTQGDDADAHARLLEARAVVGSQGQYEDGLWTYAWPWAIYLMKTGDLAFVKANFATPGTTAPPGTTQPSIEQAAHRIAVDRTGPDGIIGTTNDIDSDGLWTVDDYEALTGLAAYRYLAQRVGDHAEAAWATQEYAGLLAATNRVLGATIRRYHLTYLPCSMVQPNTANRCRNAQDANWAAPFLFGRWAWDAALFGATVDGPGAHLIDATYAYGFARLKGVLPSNTFGGYPGDYYSTAYNAGYGSWGLASVNHRDQGILSYQFMIANSQSGPYSWWESSSAPSATTPWIGNHPATGQGSSPHAWGMANANKVLLDSLVAQRADGTLVVGRGVPDAWLTAGDAIAVTNFPTTDGRRLTLRITAHGRSITVALTGARPSGAVDVQLPAFVGNLAATSAGTIDAATGTVRLPPSTRTVTITLTSAPR